MDDLGVLFFGGTVLLVLLGPWLLLWRVHSRRKRDREEDLQRCQELTSRIYALEQAVKALQAVPTTAAAEKVTPKITERPVAASFSSLTSSPSGIKQPTV